LNLNQWMPVAEKSWISRHGYDRVFGFCGVQQFILDVHLFLKVCDPYLSDRTTRVANSVCERALKTYFKRAKDPKALLKVRMPLISVMWIHSISDSCLAGHA
jgi:hypothetical protein